MEKERLIREYVIDRYQICNQKNGKGYTSFIGGKKCKQNNINDLVDQVYREVSYSENGKDWFMNLNAEFAKEAHSNNKQLNEIWIKNLTDIILNELQNRAAWRDAHIESSISSAFSGNRTACKIVPHDDVNEVDFKLIKGVVYCKEDNLFYFKKDNSYTLLGDVAELTTKNSKALRTLEDAFSKQFLEETGRQFDLINECFRMANEVKTDYFSCRNQIDSMVKANTITPKSIVKVFGEDVEVYKIFQLCSTDPIPVDWQEPLINFYAKYLINSKFPAVLINRNLCNICYETSDPGGLYFKRFAVEFTDRPPYSLYAMKLFENFCRVKNNIPSIDVIPHIISDDNTPAKFYIDKDWLSKLENQYDKLEDCKILKTFLSPYTNEEKFAIMGWAFTVFHPSYGDTINMLFKTGGGTFKTNYYSKIIQKILYKMYNANSSCTYTMLKDTWVKDRFLLEGVNGGVSTAAFVNNDECTMASIEEFKNFSGGGKNGMDYSKRTMRTDPTQMKIYSKWLFTTNNDFIIQDDSGAYDRRLFIIDRMDVKKLTPPYSKINFENEIDKEIKMFYKIAKQSYEYVLKNFGSLENYVTIPTVGIYKNLKKAYAEDDKIWVYYKLTETLYNTEDKGCWMLQKDFSTNAKMLCEENDVNFNGFKNWIKTYAIDKCVESPRYSVPHKMNGEVCKCHWLPKLKPEYTHLTVTNDSSENENNSKTQTKITQRQKDKIDELCS